jgi:Zn-dependent M28 family amino/carboxypeptidase
VLGGCLKQVLHVGILTQRVHRIMEPQQEIEGTRRWREFELAIAPQALPPPPYNGSGVAVLISLARTFAGSKSARTLRFVAFVNEEAPYAHTPQMGSWVYARRCRRRRENVTAMLSLETIGFYIDEPKSQQYPPVIRWFYPSTGDFIAFVGNTRYGGLVRDVVRTFRRCEPFPCQGGAMPEVISDIGRSDHWPFWQEGYPALMVTDTAPFRYPHYHTPEDTVDKIDFERTARVVRGLESVIRRLAAADTRP